MERDAVLGHGMSYFLNESFLVRGDEYYMAVCNKTGCIAIYNEYKNLFLSPYADGPIKFHTNPDGSLNIKNISKFGRSFSLLRIPYSFKLLIQELQTMNINMRIITDDNIDQLMNMGYSNNINKLLQTDKNIEQIVLEYTNNIREKLTDKKERVPIVDERPVLPEPEPQLESVSIGAEPISPEYAPLSFNEQIPIGTELPPAPEQSNYNFVNPIWGTDSPPPLQRVIPPSSSNAPLSIVVPTQQFVAMTPPGTPPSVNQSGGNTPPTFIFNTKVLDSQPPENNIPSILAVDTNTDTDVEKDENQDTSSSSGGSKKIVINV
jgi:hypothetical protein